MKVCLYASELAACVAKHKYVKQCDAFETVWKRVSPETYLDAMRRNYKKSDEERVSQLAESVPEVREALQAAATTATIAAPLPELPASLHDADKHLVGKFFRKEVNTRHGILQEMPVLELVKSKYGIDVRQESRFFVTSLADDVSVGGRVDGLSVDGKIVVEVKNRVNRLFLAPPEYERIQLQAYLHLVPDARYALLVESLHRPGTHRLTNVMKEYKDSDYWGNEIAPRAVAFVRFLQRIIDSQEEQNAYLTNAQRSRYISGQTKKYLTKK